LERSPLANQSPSDFISHLNRQIFDFQERLSFSERRFFFFQKLLDKALNPFPKPVIPDPFTQTSSKFRKSHRFPTPISIANPKPAAK